VPGPGQAQSAAARAPRGTGPNSIPSISMYDGQVLLGTVTIVISRRPRTGGNAKNKFVARDADRRLLGRFRSRKQALKAIGRALERSDG
jgi:hypothetical protein